MSTFQGSMQAYKKLLEEGAIQEAYRGLMAYIMDMRSYLKKAYPDYAVSGSIYYGYMDMTYFAFTPESLKQRKLKIAIVFLHEEFRFEVWLSGANKQVQSEYWELVKESGWNQYRVVSTIKGMDSIVEHILVDDPDFSDLDALTQQIEKGTLKFITDVEGFLSKTPL